MPTSATPNQMYDGGEPSTARTLALEPRRAVLRSLQAWAERLKLDAADLAAMDRILATLATADNGPDFDLVMRAARRRVIVQARERRRRMVSG